MQSTSPTEWSVEAEPFLRAILDCVAQPVWVVDHDGLIRFANPAALATLGYEELSELEGKPSHETIHYKHPDGSHYPADECPLLRPRATGETVHAEEDWFFRRDGTMFPVSYWSAPIDTPNGRGAVLAFTNTEEQRRVERAERERDIAQARASEARAAQRRIVEAGDLARRRVTRDLHDGAQQKLVSLVVNLELAREFTASEPEHAAELLETAARQARAAISELRELAAGIHPTLLTTRGLRAAVEGLADELPLPINPLEVPDVRLPAVIEGSVYFLISEALTNVVKHAKARVAGVRVAVTGSRLTVEVRDDGVGGAELRAARHGLAGLADRVEALGGSLVLESPKSSGTVLRVEIPLPEADDQPAR
ncbi:MAG TPA: PAS domain-containing sensor histidine kinase [Solirubrobacteraceae bacterium]|nr:PAS domain-containing sensor histidine kinase [Solirubrobacteraceae bacterium]